MKTATTLSLPAEAYERFLRVLGRVVPRLERGPAGDARATWGGR